MADIYFKGNWCYVFDGAKTGKQLMEILSVPKDEQLFYLNVDDWHVDDKCVRDEDEIDVRAKMYFYSAAKKINGG